MYCLISLNHSVPSAPRPAVQQSGFLLCPGFGPGQQDGVLPVMAEKPSGFQWSRKMMYDRQRDLFTVACL